ncbi:MAG: DUF1289 domain-containing protein [Pseudomonadota bacterium]
MPAVLHAPILAELVGVSTCRSPGSCLNQLRERGLNEHCLCADCDAGKVPSPCIGTCRLDDALATSVGCGRTMNEIKGWQSRSPTEQAAVLNDYEPARDRLALGRLTKRVDWSTL